MILMSTSEEEAHESARGLVVYRYKLAREEEKQSLGGYRNAADTVDNLVVIALYK